MNRLLLILSLLLFSTTASAETFMLNGTHGACTKLTRDDVARMFFCTKTVDGRELHFIKLDVALSTPPNKKNDRMVIKHETSKREMSYEPDDMSISRQGRSLIVTYLWMVPEVFVNLFREQVEAMFIFHVNDKKYDFVLTKDEKNQLRFVALFAAMKEKDDD